MSETAYDGEIPRNYDRGLGPVLFQPYAEETARRAASPEPGEVLEIAAGTGVVTRELRNRLPAGERLTATDVSEEMLAVARGKIAAGEAVAFEVVDACALPFADASFDAVVCQFGYMFFPDKPQAMREARRALRPGGRYLLAVWDSERVNPWARLCLDVLRELFPDDPPEWMKAPFSCAAIDPIKELLLASGFDDLRISVPRRTRAFDAAAFAHGLVFGSPIIHEIGERGGVDPQTVMRAYAERLARELGRDLPMQAILFEARKPA